VEDFVNGSGDAGFIVLSFGSILKGTNLPPSARDIFARVFARLPQRILWKYEDEQGIPNLSSNVRLFRWLPPYMDLLAHPKIRLIMTHGGLFSNQEAVYHEVPLIGLPVFGDQTHYTLKAQKDGYARYIDWKTMTEENLYEAITDVIDNPKYVPLQETTLILTEPTILLTGTRKTFDACRNC
jgi:glucuronosyltransferase